MSKANDLANQANAYTDSELDTLLGAKANSADVYTKAETYTRTETDSLLAGKLDASQVTEGSLNLTGIGDFTNGTIYWGKTGNTVTLSWSVLSMGVGPNPSTGPGFLPTFLRPRYRTNKTYGTGLVGQYIFDCDPNGSVTSLFRLNSGALDDHSYTETGSISYLTA